MDVFVQDILAVDVARIGMGEYARSPVVYRVHGGDPIILMSAHGAAITTPVGIWVETSALYPPQVLSRALKTLSYLVPLDTVIVSGEHAGAAATIVRHLLSDDEVTLSNEAATLVGATNHPAPPLPLTVWHTEGFRITNGRDYLVETNRTDTWCIYRNV